MDTTVQLLGPGSGNERQSNRRAGLRAFRNGDSWDSESSRNGTRILDSHNRVVSLSSWGKQFSRQELPIGNHVAAAW